MLTDRKSWEVQTGEVTGNDGRGKRQIVGDYDENEGQELGILVWTIGIKRKGCY